jgi:hypothetical protein
MAPIGLPMTCLASIVLKSLKAAWGDGEAEKQTNKKSKKKQRIQENVPG